MIRTIRRDGVPLAVPVMHPHTPRDVRVRIYEAVLARQFGLAVTLAEIESDLIEHGAARRRELGLAA